MNKPVSIILLAVGLILLVYGLMAGDSLASNVKESVTGTPTDKSLWLTIGGIVAVILGGYGLIRGNKT